MGEREAECMGVQLQLTDVAAIAILWQQSWAKQVTRGKKADQ